ncbi:hypothetical protein [Mycobacterium palustre]|uniref:Minor tail protein n=1 Tax=Mycobacterium palustre TaxID=153971 RepID=A0A1X1ZLL9_9MYCO|nr:hypothetical protein [Mycobacterium palustre]MCV7100970.1 hypothetical protein [Mycobacterium palustre]ORW24011.1 hypothetical protein AWC19_00190 [Mycobacterium palustre]
MPSTDWYETTIDGQDWLIVPTGQLRIPLPFDPSAPVIIAVAPPLGGIASFGALVKGDPGFPAQFDEDVDFTPLEPDDPTADFASLTLVSPATDVSGPSYKLALGLHKGAKGDDGAAVLTPSDYGTPAPGKTLILNPDGSAFILATPKVGDTYYPASLNNTASGNPTSTLGVVAIPPQDFDWRPKAFAQTMISPTGSNVRVDVIARLNGESDGNDVGRGFGMSGATERISITPGAPAGSPDEWDRVPAGQSATVHLRVERQSGSDTFTTSATTTRFAVKVDPIP